MVKDSKQRIVITGLGVLSPIGIGRRRFWDALIHGKNGVQDITLFDTSLYKTHKGGEVKNFNPQRYIRRIRIPSSCRSTQLAIAASRLALDDAGVKKDFLDSESERIGVIVGSTSIDSNLGEEYVLRFSGKKYKALPKKLATTLNWMTVGPALSISREFGISGLSMSIPAACAAGNYCIAYAYDLLRTGRLDMVLAGGTDSMNKLVFSGFNSFFAMAPTRCQPFDKNRKGLIVGEGAGILVLETLEHARKRKAHIYGEILGYGLGCDAYHPTRSHPEGIEGVKTIRTALKNARLKPSDIDYINAHGTGTISNDKTETKIIKKVFGRRAKRIPVSSIKSMIGHSMGAASAIEAVACALVVEKNIIPPTINYDTPDPECDLDYVPNKARKREVRTVLSNSFAFGGNIGVLLIGKYHA
jgi:3-oxoacyl-[acyl-carrier-protein] synthase II